MRSVRRGIFVALTIAWFGATWWYWRNVVPLQPSGTFTVPKGASPIVVGQRGEVLLPGPSGNPAAGGYLFGSGPVECRSIRDGSLLRSILKSGDEIRGLNYPSYNRAVVQGGESVRVVDLATGADVCALTGCASAKEFAFVADGRVLLALVDGDVIAFDSETGQIQWRRSGVRFTGFNLECGSPDLIVLTRPKATGAGVSSLSDYQLVSVETGELDPVLGDIPFRSRVKVSPDGRRVAAFPMTKCDVYDRMTGKLLWSASLVYDDVARFSPDGSELQAQFELPDGAPALARWNADDGRVIAEWPKDARSSKAVVSPDGRYAITSVPRWPAPKAALLFAVQHNWPKVSAALMEGVYAVRDLKTQAVFGRAPAEQNIPAMLPDGSGFTLQQRSSTYFYPLPPRRSGLWLIGWWSIPFVFLLLKRGARHLVPLSQSVAAKRRTAQSKTSISGGAV